jgi:hypothetical protein
VVRCRGIFIKFWLRRAYKRNLLTDKEIDVLQKLTRELTPKLSAYIRSIGKKPINTGEDETSEE